MIINGLKIDTDIVTFLDVYAEVVHEKNILISAKDKFLNNTRKELDETKRVAECRLRAIKELEEEIKKLKEENEKLKKLKNISEEVKKNNGRYKGGKQKWKR